MERKAKGIGIWVLVALGLAVVVLVLFERSPTPRSFSFVTVDHPVNMWQDGPDTWAYFSLGSGSTVKVAEMARKELLAQGFTEDISKAPWHRFVKGNEEVVVCNHYEFAVNGTKLVFNRLTPPSGATANEWPCVLVKNSAGTDASLTAFQVKKLLHGW